MGRCGLHAGGLGCPLTGRPPADRYPHKVRGTVLCGRCRLTELGQGPFL
jgi:hypothetical protein